MGKSPTSIRFPEAKRVELKIESAKRGMTMEQAIVQAYDQWALSQPSGESLQDLTENSENKLVDDVSTSKYDYTHTANRQQILDELTELLKQIVASDNRAAIEAIGYNLVAFARLVAIEGEGINADATPESEEQQIERLRRNQEAHRRNEETLRRLKASLHRGGKDGGPGRKRAS
jgi:hypothetical protein